MNDSHKSELLSAYLDRETSAAEQAEIEQALENDPGDRQLLDQFSQLGELLRELPEEKVQSSFAANVMGKIREQAPAHAADSIPSETVASDSAGQRSLEHATEVRLASADPLAAQKRYRQVVVWGIVAAAAALLLAAYPAGLLDFLSPQRPDGNLVEQNGENDPANLVIVPTPPVPNDNDPGNDVVPVDNVVPPTPNDPPIDPGALVQDPPQDPTGVVPNVPGSNPLVDPGGNNSPFVSPEDEKILRLLESLVLVKIECTPPTAKTREFEKVLQKYKIKVAEKATPEQANGAPLPSTVVYYIESSVAQAEAVLSEVSARNNEFTSMNMVTETHTTRNTLNVNPSETPDIPEALPDNGSFAEKMHLQTQAELDAMKDKPGQPPSASQVLPFLRGQSDLDDILGKSQVKAEHLVRMLVVLETVEPKNEE